MPAFTASDARKITDRAFKARDKACTKARRGREQTITVNARAMAKRLLPNILADIQKKCKHGKYIEYGVYRYHMGNSTLKDETKVRAYKLVMEQLSGAPYNYRVETGEQGGYNGDGNNMSDFYTHHTWTVSW